MQQCLDILRVEYTLLARESLGRNLKRKLRMLEQLRTLEDKRKKNLVDNMTKVVLEDGLMHFGFVLVNEQKLKEMEYILQLLWAANQLIERKELVANMPEFLKHFAVRFEHIQKQIVHKEMLEKEDLKAMFGLHNLE